MTQISPALLLELAAHLTKDGHCMSQDHSDEAAAWLRNVAASLPQQDASALAADDVKDAARYRWLKSQFRVMSLDMGGKHSWALAHSLPGAVKMDAVCDAGLQSNQGGR